MARKRLTQIFPWLLPLRRRQRKLCFYLRMAMDGGRYARAQMPEKLPYLVFETRCPMINEATGFDIKYQHNKVFNLRLAAKKLDGLLIRPGERFSFYQAIRGADRHEPYREGLVEINGRLTTEYGGGLCMMSNLLFWTLLHTGMEILERHGHREKDFPEPESDAVRGVDAAVAEGWLDLKFLNGTGRAYQLGVDFADGCIIGRVYADGPCPAYAIENGPAEYIREDDGIYEQVPVLRKDGGKEKLLYMNRCRIGYPLPEGTEIKEKK